MTNDLRHEDRSSPWTLRIGLGVAFFALVMTSMVAAHSHSPAVGAVTTVKSGSSQHPASPIGPYTTSPATFRAPSRACAFTTQPRRVPATRLGRCVVLEIGDSLGNDLGWGLAREIAPGHGVVLVQQDKSSTGLTNAWFYDWPTHLRYYLALYHPHVVLICIGANDARDLKVGNQYYAFGTPGWRRTYDRFVRQIETEDFRAGARTMWVGMPIMASAYYRTEMQVLNQEVRSVTQTIPGATYLDVWRLFADGAGRYRQYAYVNHVVQNLRSPDGIHMSSAGENVFSSYVTTALAYIYHVRLTPAAPTTITG